MIRSPALFHEVECETMSKRTRSRWIRRIVWGAVTWFVVTLFFGPFGYVSICRDCGREQHETEFRLPLIDLPYFWFHSETDTEFSSRLRPLVPSHECRWLFGHGGGPGLNASCALGDGSSLLNIVRRKRITSFILNVDRFEGRATARSWIAKSLDPNQSDSVRSWLLSTDFPESGFETEIEYRKWKSIANTESAYVLEPR